MLSGAGAGLEGLVGTLLPILKDKDKKTYDYIAGKTRTFRTEVAEAEFMSSTCF